MARKKYIELSYEQKEEIRRLTQLANRRIKNTEKAYSKEGKHILPKEVVGDFQIKEKWQTKTSPLSRSIKFETKEDYLRQLRMLRSFEREKLGIKDYTKIQREKTEIAMLSSLEVDELPKEILSELNKMSAPQLADFWKEFSDRASKMGVNYSSDSAMSQTINEFFKEDIENLLS